MTRCFLYGLVFLIVAGVRPAADLTCGETTGTLQNSTYNSAILERTMDYALYLPPCYDATSTYPVIYLLHGSNRSHEHWPSLGIASVLDRGIVGGAFPPVVVAMPFGSWIANENRFTGTVTWSNMLLSEFMPYIESSTAVSQDRAGRAIGGISRGGFWAFNIALRFPQMFSVVGGHSAFFDPGHFPEEFNPLNLAATAPDVDTLRIWLDRGADDYAQYGFDLMHEALTERGIEHQYTVYPEGEHVDAYWASHLEAYLTFYTAAFPNDAAQDLPTIAHTFDTSGVVDLLLPVTAFRGVPYDLPMPRLLGIYAGALDFDLVLTARDQATLQAMGATVNPQTVTVPDDAALLAYLQANVDAFTLLPLGAITPRLRLLLVDGLLPLDQDLSAYPFVAPGSSYDPAVMTRILFSGVTAISRRTREAININGIPWAASGIEALVQRPDYFHISNEVSFAPRCPESDEPVIGGLCAEDAHFALLERLDIDIVELTGNHNNDYGFNAYQRTLDFYDGAGMLMVGGGATLAAAREPLILETDVGTVALLACNWNGPDYALATADTPGATFCEMDWLTETIPALKAAHDVVIVTVQYAEYDQPQPIERQVYHFQQVAALGADVVIGTQAHQPQTFDFYDETFIHYGMGNLYFDQTGAAQVQFFMDEVIIYDGIVRNVALHPGMIEGLGRPRWMTPAEREPFLAAMLRAD
jgi:enterochelin esterase-like enzyme